jgi:hypothetical protein
MQDDAPSTSRRFPARSSVIDMRVHSVGRASYSDGRLRSSEFRVARRSFVKRAISRPSFELKTPHFSADFSPGTGRFFRAELGFRCELCWRKKIFCKALRPDNSAGYDLLIKSNSTHPPRRVFF